VQGIAVAPSINHLRSESLDTGARTTLGSPTVSIASIPTRFIPMLALAGAAFALFAAPPHSRLPRP